MESKINFDKAMKLAKELEEKDNKDNMVEAHVLTRSSARYDFIYHLVMEGIL